MAKHIIQICECEGESSTWFEVGSDTSTVFDGDTFDDEAEAVDFANEWKDAEPGSEVKRI